MPAKPIEIEKPAGKLGVLIPGMGAVATTVLAGVEAIRRTLASPIGSLTQMGTIRLGKRTEGKSPAIKDFVPLAALDDLVFAGWDVFPDNACDAAIKAGVLERTLLDQVKDFLEGIRPMPAVFEQKFVKNLHGKNLKRSKSKMELAEHVMDDIREFRRRHDVSRLVMVWCGSTETFLKPSAVHQSLAAFERGLKANSAEIAPSMIYAYAALKSGVPFANGAPNLTVDTPALQALALKKCLPICGKDFKTGQTLMKTILAPGLKARLLGLRGWFHEHSRQSRWRGAGRSRLIPHQRGEQAFGARIHFAARAVSRSLQEPLSQSQDQLLSSTR